MESTLIRLFHGIPQGFVCNWFGWSVVYCIGRVSTMDGHHLLQPHLLDDFLHVRMLQLFGNGYAQLIVH